MDRAILHVDMNSCYASIECFHHPEIRGYPVAVGGDVESRHGIILAKNQLAKKYGIKTGEALWQAKQKCLGLVIVPPHYDLYLRYSRLARKIYGEYTNLVEPFGLDECWLDVTGSKVFGSPEEIVEKIRQRIKFELGITVSIGVSWNKIFAKLGSDYKKPDAITIFHREDMEAKIWSLPVEDLLYVGPATERKLKSRCVKTIGDLANTPPSLLQSWLGKMGLILHSFANGLDTSPVSPIGEQVLIKSVGNALTDRKSVRVSHGTLSIFLAICNNSDLRCSSFSLDAKSLQRVAYLLARSLGISADSIIALSSAPRCEVLSTIGNLSYSSLT